MLNYRVVYFAFIALFINSYSIIASELNFSYKQEVNPFIMSQGSLEEPTLVAFIFKNNSSLNLDYIKKIVITYIEESRKEGVNHDIAISQMLLETGFLRYKGQVSSHQNNFGGLGALDSGEKGAFFSSLEEGVRAHVQHLKAYASTKGLQEPLVDPRFQLVTRGSARTFYELTGRWATDKVYHHKISSILTKILVYDNERRLAITTGNTRGI